MGFKFQSHGRWLTIVLLCVDAVCGKAGAAERVQRPVVQIQLYDSAHVPAATLERARREVVRIFAAAGVGAVWINCSAHFSADKDACRISSDRKQFVVHIIPKGKTSTDSVFGEAFIGDDGIGKYADIFFDRIEAMHAQCGIDTSQLLGAVAAHELGHLLLGVHAHSWLGLMAPVWQKEILRHVNMGDLLFTREQAVRLQLRIRESDTRPVNLKAQAER
jgi:hypothetical protein